MCFLANKSCSRFMWKFLVIILVLSLFLFELLAATHDVYVHKKRSTAFAYFHFSVLCLGENICVLEWEDDLKRYFTIHLGILNEGKWDCKISWVNNIEASMWMRRYTSEKRLEDVEERRKQFEKLWHCKLFVFVNNDERF